MTDSSLPKAMMAAVLDEPGEVVHRLALADWLEENGHSERAAFLRGPTFAPRRTKDLRWLRGMILPSLRGVTPKSTLLYGNADHLFESALDGVTISSGPRDVQVGVSFGFIRTLVAPPFRILKLLRSGLLDVHPVERVSPANFCPDRIRGRPSLTVGDGNFIDGKVGVFFACLRGGEINEDWPYRRIYRDRREMMLDLSEAMVLFGRKFRKNRIDASWMLPEFTEDAR